MREETKTVQYARQLYPSGICQSFADFATEMLPAYHPQAVEASWEDYWDAEGLFGCSAPAAEAAGPSGRFVMVSPPPNVTGSLHLGHALGRRIKLQVGCHDAHSAQDRVAHRHAGGHARHRPHAAWRGVGRPGQRVVLHLQYRQAGCNEVAELLPLAGVGRVGAELIHGGTEKNLVAGQQRAQDGRLIEIRATWQPGVMDRDLLHADHVKAAWPGECLRFAHDPLDTDNLVEAAEPLHIPGDELHGAPT